MEYRNIPTYTNLHTLQSLCTIGEDIYISASSLVTLVAGRLNHTPPIAKRGWDPYPATPPITTSHINWLAVKMQPADRPCETKEFTTPFQSGLHTRAESPIRSSQVVAGL